MLRSFTLRRTSLHSGRGLGLCTAALIFVGAALTGPNLISGAGRPGETRHAALVPAVSLSVDNSEAAFAAEPNAAPAAESQAAFQPTDQPRAPAPATVAALPANFSPPSPPIMEASSTRAVAAVPQAAVQAAPSLTAPDLVTPGQRWAAAGVSYVFAGQDWDATSLTNVDLALSKLPARVLAQVGNRSLGGISVLVNRSGRTLSGKQPYGDAANFFSTNDGRNELILFPDQPAPTVLHELGHAYNLRHTPAGRYPLVLLDPEMQSFMAATRWRVLSSAGQIEAARDQTTVDFVYEGAFTWPKLSRNDPLEDFANSFALYFSSSADLKAQSPERYAWFEANVGH